MSSVKLYKSVNTLPLWNYIRVVETDDLRYLAILDYYDDLPQIEVDRSIWDGIMLDYFDSLNNQKSRNYIKKYVSLIVARKEILLLTDSLFVLRYKNDKEIIAIVEKILKKYNPTYKYDIAKYYNSLIHAENQLKGLIKKYELNSQSIDKNNNVTNKKVDLYKVIDAVQRYNKIIINPKDITVRQFVSMVQTMNEQINIENGKRKAGNRRTR